MAFDDSLRPFADGLKKASDIIVDAKPNYIIAPMMGSVPFIDVMNIMNEEFDPSKVYYMPASSHLPNVNDLLHRWVKNFLEANVDEKKPIKIMGIDEVVSGSSAVRVYRAITKEIDNKKKSLTSNRLSKFYTTDPQEFEQACTELGALTDSKYYSFLSKIAQEQRQGRYVYDDALLMDRQNTLVNIVKSHVDGLISYKGIGIEDSKIEVDSNKTRRKEYLDIRAAGGIVPVPVKAIITMDKPELCPAVYERMDALSGSGYVKFAPKVSEFRVTHSYLGLLTQIAMHGGKNPRDISPVNMNRILECSEYLK